MTHGRASGWRWHKCRCELCHAALLDEARLAWASAQVRRGHDPATRVPAIFARDHIAALERSGLTRTTIARRAGVSAGTISRLSKPSTARASRITVLAVLEVPLP